MSKVQAEIQGTRPYLQHRCDASVLQADKKKKKDHVYDSETDAKAVMYQDANGAFIPSEQIEACLREAGKNHKIKGNATYKAVIQSSVWCEEDKIYLGKDMYDEIDVRPAVVQRQRVARSRPKFNQWGRLLYLSLMTT